MSAPQTNFELQSFNTLNTPSIADFFWSASDEDALTAALAWAKKKQLSVHVIGAGSNVILAKHIRGLVLQPALQGKKIRKEDDRHVWLEAGAGENWHQLVSWCIENDYYGLENLALIPGTVGAAPVQNIGAYGVELSDVFESLRGIDQNTLQWQDMAHSQCQFAYRDSVFKRDLKGQFIITSVVLKLSKVATVKCDYPGLRETLDGYAQVLPQQVFDAVIKVRQSKLPDPKILPNAGSFFKNPLVDSTVADRLRKTFPEAKIFAHHDNLYKVAAGWLIDKAGLRGQSIHGLTVHRDQALVLTNPHGCDANKILEAAEFIQKVVKEKFEIDLELEPQVLDS